MKIVSIMPIKMNNERLPGKNTKLLGNKPLIHYLLDSLLKVERINEVYVYCSNEKIQSFLPNGVEFLRRDKRLDEPTSNFNQIFDSFINDVYADIYVYAHATAPFITRETIDECITEVLCDEYDSAFCSVKIQDYLWKDGKALNFDPKNLPRSQDLKPIYRETSGIYVIPREMYKKYGRRVGDNPYIKEVSFKESIDINNPEDFELAEIMINY